MEHIGSRLTVENGDRVAFGLVPLWKMGLHQPLTLFGRHHLGNIISHNCNIGMHYKQKSDTTLQ